MEEFTRELFTYRDHALKSAGLATRHLIRLLHSEQADLATAMADAAEWRSYARWWTSITDHIEHDGLDAVTALAQARISAHAALLYLPTPRHECPYATAQETATTEAARRFFRDTATLHPATPHRPDTFPGPDAG